MAENCVLPAGNYILLSSLFSHSIFSDNNLFRRLRRSSSEDCDRDLQLWLAAVLRWSLRQRHNKPDINVVDYVTNESSIQAILVGPLPDHKRSSSLMKLGNKLRDITGKGRWISYTTEYFINLSEFTEISESDSDESNTSSY